MIILLFLAGCGGGNSIPNNNSNTNPNPGTTLKGSLKLTITVNGFSAKTIQPNIDMTIATYNISGTGPDGTTFQNNGVTGSAATINALATGNWTITVNALNSTGTIISAGYTTVVIADGQTANANVTVSPLTGTGILNISLSWPSGSITNPVITATLTPQGGTAGNITFTLGSDGVSATYQNNVINAGYYTLLVYLYDGTTFKWGAADAVRILAGQTSNGSYPIVPGTGFGGINIIITPDLQNPIGITFSGAQSNLTVGTNMTVTATTSEPVDSCQWYLNGRPLSGQTGSSITIGSSLGAGTYRLDLIVTQGNIVSSGTVPFTILSPTATAANPTSVQLSGLTLSDGTLAPLFTSIAYAYTASVGYDQSSITVTATVQDSRATIKVNGVPATSGQPSAPINLNVGSNTVTVQVTPFIGDPQNYTITVTRASSPYLTGLVFKVGHSTITLTPPFNRNTFTYTATSGGITSVSITATAEDSNAIIQINGNNATSGVAMSIPVTTGSNPINVVITSSTGDDQRTYLCTLTD